MGGVVGEGLRQRVRGQVPHVDAPEVTFEVALSVGEPVRVGPPEPVRQMPCHADEVGSSGSDVVERGARGVLEPNPLAGEGLQGLAAFADIDTLQLLLGALESEATCDTRLLPTMP